MRKRIGLRRYAGLTAIVATAALAVAGIALAVAGAVSTTDNPTFTGPGTYANQACLNGHGVNCNIYLDKRDVWLSGLPVSSALGAGTYFFEVGVPGGQPDPNDGGAKNLSDTFVAPYSTGDLNGDGSAIPTGDLWTNREFTVDGDGNITAYAGNHNRDGNKLQVFPYDDTTNNGGVYILGVCKVPSGAGATTGVGTPGVNPRDCKYDAFKVMPSGEPPTTPPATGATVTKDAAGAYNTTYKWNISKSVDATSKSALNGTVKFTYTVHVTHDAGTNSAVSVTGTISVFNANSDPGGTTVPMEINSLTDALSGGATKNCTVDSAPSVASPATLSDFETDFTYSCDLGSTVPTSAVTNTVTVGWADQQLNLSGDPGNLSTLAAGSSDFATSVAFTQTLVDNCTNLTDPVPSGGSSSNNPFPTSVCVGQVGPPADGGAGTGATAGFTFVYDVTYNVPTHGCTSYKNTASESTDLGSASVTVSVCRVPPATGALTMGFWQNKNGQGIITGQAKTGTCPSATWLRTFNPFNESALPATATCSATATYVLNVIKAATCTSTSKTCNAMLKAQMLATALDVYFSDSTLGGNKIGAYNGKGNAQTPVGSVSIDLTQICSMIDGSGGTATCGANSYRSVSNEFGGATSLTVLQMLQYMNLDGTAFGNGNPVSNLGGTNWYLQIKSKQVNAKDAFDAINNQVAFSA